MVSSQRAGQSWASSNAIIACVGIWSTSFHFTVLNTLYLEIGHFFGIRVMSSFGVLPAHHVTVDHAAVYELNPKNQFRMLPLLAVHDLILAHLRPLSTKKSILAIIIAVPAVPLRALICDPHNRGIEPPRLLGLQPDLNRTQTLDNHSQVDGEALPGIRTPIPRREASANSSAQRPGPRATP